METLVEKEFMFESKNRTLSVSFFGDSLCLLKNTFHCDDISADYREIEIKCTFKRVENVIYLKNTKCKGQSCKYDIVIDIPPQESKKCFFLSEEARYKEPLGPNYLNSFERFGLVPNIDIDTMRIIGHKIVLIKKEGNMSVGYIFK